MRRNKEFVQFDQAVTLEEMPNGFMSMIANLTRTGIFTYSETGEDGKTRMIRQLRLAEEVFSEETVASLSGLPLTNNHPSELISPDNASDYIVGMTSDQPKRIFAPIHNTDSEEEEYVQQRMTVFDGPTIKDIRTGRKREISLGYTCNLDYEKGTYKGQPYDAIQRNIRYNHVSLVNKARGGPNCKILLDGVEVNFDGESNEQILETEMKKFKFKGKELEVSDDVHAVLVTLSDSLTETTKSLERQNAVTDELTSKLKVQTDADDQAAFRKAVKARVSLESRAQKILGEAKNLDSLTDREIKEACIKEMRDGLDLAGKSDDYVDARFDVVCEDHKEEGNSDVAKMGKKIQADSADDPFTKAEEARKAAWERSKKMYLGGKK